MTQPEMRPMLARTEIFEGLSPHQYGLVSFICESKTFRRGEILLRENEMSDDLYVIGQGGVNVLMDASVVSAAQAGVDAEPVLLIELRAGQVFGEIALVDQGVRSATIQVSRDDTLVLQIKRERLMLLCDTYPEMGYKIMRNLAADLAIKIRNTGFTFRQYQLLLSQKHTKPDE